MGWYQINLTYQVKEQILLVIRLARTGRRNQPKFRVVVAEHSKPVDGNTVEIVGHFEPAAPNKPFVIDREAVSKWIGQGAKPTNTVARLLNKYEGFDLLVKQRPARPPKKEAKQKAEAKPETSKTEGSAEQPTAEVKKEPATEPEAPKEEAKVQEEPAPTEAGSGETPAAETSAPKESTEESEI